MHVSALRVLRRGALAELLVASEERRCNLEPLLEDLSPVLRFLAAPLGAGKYISNKSNLLLGSLGQTDTSSLGLGLNSPELSL
eukprot:10541059-Alexandrium_andersonii.AAC.1